MKRARFSMRLAGLTLVEMSIGGLVSTAVGLAVFAFLDAGSYLSAKNLSLNLTSNQMRGALDRVEQVMQQGDEDSDPVLISTTGAAVANGTAAAGVRFDRYIDSPYVADLTTTVTGSTQVKLNRATASIASLKVAKGEVAGNVIRFDGTASSVRPRIVQLGVYPDYVAAGSGIEALVCPLASALTATYKPTSGDVLTAKLVRQVAFIVMPSGGKNELRYYPTYESTTDLSDPTKYQVITDQIGLQAADATPFNTTTVGTKTFINFSLRVRSSTTDNRLIKRQSDEYNTFSRVDLFLRPKVNR
jgi:hypothetical protein